MCGNLNCRSSYNSQIVWITHIFARFYLQRLFFYSQISKEKEAWFHWTKTEAYFEAKDEPFYEKGIYFLEPNLLEWYIYWMTCYSSLDLVQKYSHNLGLKADQKALKFYRFELSFSCIVNGNLTFYSGTVLYSLRRPLYFSRKLSTWEEKFRGLKINLHRALITCQTYLNMGWKILCSREICRFLCASKGEKWAVFHFRRR